MSSTRYASNGAQLQQQRWASNRDFSTSVSALLAAKRIALIDDRATRELLWWIQWRSLEPRGLRRLVDELIAMFPQRFGTPTMRRLRLQPGKRLTRAQTIELRKDFPAGEFLLRGEAVVGLSQLLDGAELEYAHDAPAYYRSDDFISKVSEAAQSLHEHLMQMCVNPEIDAVSAGVACFEDLCGALLQCKKVLAANADDALADTEVNRLITSALGFCFRRRRMILIEGKAGIGKTDSIKAWCNRSQGLARYVEVPAANDDRSFFVAIAASLGVARGASYNTQQVKLKVEEALRESGLMLVFDEAQFLWPQYVRPQGIPARMQWIKTMFDAGTPIALVALPKFSQWQELYAKRTLWEQEQLERRINRKVALPGAHSNDDLLKIARAKHPTGDKACWMLLAGYARAATKKQASAITEALETARDFAEQDGRETITYDDIDAAVKLDFKPAPTPTPTSEKPARKPDAAAVLHRRCSGDEKVLQTRSRGRFERHTEPVTG